MKYVSDHIHAEAKSLDMDSVMRQLEDDSERRAVFRAIGLALAKTKETLNKTNYKTNPRGAVVEAGNAFEAHLADMTDYTNTEKCPVMGYRTVSFACIRERAVEGVLLLKNGISDRVGRMLEQKEYAQAGRIFDIVYQAVNSEVKDKLVGSLYKDPVGLATNFVQTGAFLPLGNQQSGIRK